MKWCSKCYFNECEGQLDLCTACKRDFQRFVREGGPTRRVPREMYCGVYFFLCGDFIKIGSSTNFVDRLRAMRTGNPVTIRVLGVIPTESQYDAVKCEYALHDRFKGKYHRDEWFEDCPEIRAYIDEHAITKYFQ